MNRQESFNKVWDRSVVRKVPPSIDAEGNCLYKPLNGNFEDGCHFGCLLTEQQYDPEMEGSRLSAIFYAANSFNNIAKAFPREDFLFFEGLQNIHDTWVQMRLRMGPVGPEDRTELDPEAIATFSADMEKELLKFAKIYNLTIPV